MDSPQFDVSPDNGSSRGRSQGNHKKRIRVWTEDDRAKHRVFEKGRREAFSDSLLSLARFLPSLTSVKESKLSKHTIVDESLKYHQLQKTKLEDLQKIIAALEAEKEALLTELSGWRECLEAPAEQPVTLPAEQPRATITQNNINQVGAHDSSLIYDDTVVSHSTQGIGLPAELPVSYDLLAGSVSNPAFASQVLDNYTHQNVEMSSLNQSSLHSLPRASQYSAHDVRHREIAQHASWPSQQVPHMQQPLWTQPSYQEVPLDYASHQF